MRSFSILYKVPLWVFLIVTLAVSSAGAIEFKGIGGRPANPDQNNERTSSIFIYNEEPGSVVEDGIRVINNTEETKTLTVYGADSTHSSGGAFACEQLSETKNEVGAWINLEEQEVELEPYENKVIPFTLNIPHGLGAGEYDGCIAIQDKQVEDEENTGLNLSTRTALRVAVTIPGELVREIQVTDFHVAEKEGGFLFGAVIENLGNVSIDADVRMVTKGLFGFEVESHGGSYPILRGETSELNFDLKSPFWGGWFESSLIVHYDAGEGAKLGISSGEPLTKLEAGPIKFFSPPTKLGFLIELSILLFVLLAGAMGVLRVVRRNWIRRSWVYYQPHIGEDIRKVAKKFDVNWKLLAKVNKMKPPYAFKAGQKIKVPKPKDNKVRRVVT